MVVYFQPRLGLKLQSKQILLAHIFWEPILSLLDSPVSLFFHKIMKCRVSSPSKFCRNWKIPTPTSLSKSYQSWHQFPTMRPLSTTFPLCLQLFCKCWHCLMEVSGGFLHDRFFASHPGTLRGDTCHPIMFLPSLLPPCDSCSITEKSLRVWTIVYQPTPITLPLYVHMVCEIFFYFLHFL